MKLNNIKSETKSFRKQTHPGFKPTRSANLEEGKDVSLLFAYPGVLLPLLGSAAVSLFILDNTTKT